MDHLPASNSPVQPVTTGLVAALVGYAGSVSIVIKGLAQSGASEAVIASALFAIGLTMGLPAIVLSLRNRQPVSIAWSTPGAALLAGSSAVHGGFPAVAGAILAAGGLITAAGLWPAFGRLATAIPAHIANAMLAGILASLCLAPVEAAAVMPGLALPVIAVWLICAGVTRLWAVPAATLATIAALWFSGSFAGLPLSWQAPAPLIIMPAFNGDTLISIALPLFLVTMASQNIPGLAVLKSNGYTPKPGPIFILTGIATMIGAGFGAVPVNLAAMTASLCAGAEAGADRSRRWQASAIAGLGYIALGLIGGVATTIALAAPPVLIEAVAGLALLGALGAALQGATRDRTDHLAAAATFVVTVAGHGFLGIGAAFWGILAGLTAEVVTKQNRFRLPARLDRRSSLATDGD